eukprot:TRINITY_DN16786_c1_g3_i1.p1 TRINITY_DN16786_c1_g3~~TRINITY_DN16786_c1_g3_i1.p1  ORF type:complete len:1262 (+),score=301.23 TRINITY_DN16786_c1_g3_i1:140-3925(+)
MACCLEFLSPSSRQATRREPRLPTVRRQISRGRTNVTFSEPPEEFEMDDDVGQSCCVVWTLGRDSELSVTRGRLQDLHREVLNCRHIVGARALDTSATSGAFECLSGAGGSLAAADAALYAGMLLCRWAAAQEDELDFRVGVHIGVLRKLQLPEDAAQTAQSRCRYFGPALSIARQLAERAPKGFCVHFNPETRKALSVFGHLPMCVSMRKTYYIEPWSQSDFEKYEALLHRCCHASKDAVVSRRREMAMVPLEDMAKMDLNEFEDYLKAKGVDTAGFGKGPAKSIGQFFDELVKERKSYLRDEEGVLERCLSIARIKVRARDLDGTTYSLNMGLEIGEDGVARNRDLLLGSWVHEDRSWEDEVARCFEERLLVPRALQKKLLSTEAYWFKEEKLVSSSIPGLSTTYMTHEVQIRVNMPPPEGLSVLGLPGLTNFMTEAPAVGKRFHWTWIPEGSPSTNNKNENFIHFLQSYGVNVAEFDPRVLDDFLEEVHDTKVSTIEVHDGQLLRCLSILKVWIAADILSVPHVLLTQSKVRRRKREEMREGAATTMRLVRGQRWEDAVPKLLVDRLGVEESVVKEHVSVDKSSYRLLEETAYSSSYPGIKTRYLINEVTCRVSHEIPHIGLPHGESFTVSRIINSNLNEVVTTRYIWTPQVNLRTLPSTASSKEGDSEPDAKRRVPRPPPERLLQFRPGTNIQELMRGRKTDWTCARNAARRIRDPTYTVKQYFEDCVAAFPELDLYLAGGADAGTTSGRSSDDEYQRTMGALFAFYWLMRLHLDGAECFTFGVGGNNWTALSATSLTPKRCPKEVKKRKDFLASMSWESIRCIFIKAGFLSESGESHDEEQTLAMLVLTAIHDIMKLEPLIPEVRAEHVGDAGNFRGYVIGDKIGDHDIALAYTLEHMPEMFPSYAGLPASKQAIIKFTQADIEFNMGWLVQAEAPPGALFRKFKQVMTSGKANPASVAFYFVHWLTDLAGAEPCPLEGCEKFVLKFPMAVLVLFLRSFPQVSELSQKTETRTLEDYLAWRWEQVEPSLGPVPTGEGSVAMLRLASMAQGNVKILVDAFSVLPDAGRTLLSRELAMTGIANQAFRNEVVPEGSGPAFLVYYAPALMQKNGGAPKTAEKALNVLVEVLRQARLLWPLSTADADKVVTLRIDQLKQQEPAELGHVTEGEFWALQRTSGVDAQVTRARLFDDGQEPQEHDWSTMRALFFTMPPSSTLSSEEGVERTPSFWNSADSRMSLEARNWLRQQSQDNQSKETAK